MSSDTPQPPLTDVEAEVIKLYKKAGETVDPLYMTCTGEHHGVGDGDGMTVSCLLSFKIRKDVSQERHTQILQAFFDSLTSRVDEAFQPCVQPTTG